MVDFSLLMDLISKDRELYIELLKLSRKKSINFKKGRAFRHIIEKQIILCKRLASRGIIGREKLKQLQSKSNYVILFEKNTNEINSFIVQLCNCYENQRKGLNKSLLIEESNLHKQIRKAFFQIIRLLMETLKNLKNKPIIYVIIPAFNEEGNIEKALKSVMQQSYPNKRIVVVDNGSDDRTVEVAKKYTQEVIFLKRRSVGLARNLGAKYAIKNGAEIVVYLDADSLMKQSLLEKVWQSVYLTGVKAGICLTQLDENHWRARLFSFLHNLNRLVFKVPHTFMFATKEVVESVSFWETNQLGEDVNWAHLVIKKFGFHNFKVIKGYWLITSARRFEAEGYFSIVKRWAQTWPFGLITKKKDMDYF